MVDKQEEMIKDQIKIMEKKIRKLNKKEKIKA